MTKILTVDDDENLHDGLRRGFRSIRPAWDIEFAANGADALEKVANDDFDVLVTDMDMPGMNGVELLAEVRDASPNTMRVVISGRYDNLSTYSMTTCSHLFIAKPFDVLALVDLIEPALNFHRLELRRTSIWLESVIKSYGSPDVGALPSHMRSQINRDRLRQLGINLDK